MAYDEETAQRMRSALSGLEGLSEKRMMGGLCFLVNGNMIGAADRPKDGAARFMFRIGKDNQAAGNALPGAEPLIQGGRRMSGFFFVDEAGCEDSHLKQWLSLALSHAMSLPPK